MARLTSTGIQFSLLDATETINSFYWIYPAGTRKIFFQASAPTGWTQVTTLNDRALRVVSGTGGGTGGSLSFTTVLSSSAGNLQTTVNDTFPVGIPPGVASNVGNHTLSLTELPDHAHTSLFTPSGGSGATPFSNAGGRLVFGSSATGTMNESTGGGAHNHPFSGSTTINQTVSGAINLAVDYVDVIICSLN